ncbi:MAG: hypothetical protein U0930_05535 [Pirellulales bacterium]
MSSQTPQPNSIPEEWLSAYLDDELDADQRQMVESAVRQNPQMAQLFRDLQATRTLVQQLPSFPSMASMRNRSLGEGANADLEDGLQDTVTPSNLATRESASHSVSNIRAGEKRLRSDRIDSDTDTDTGVFRIGSWELSQWRTIALAASVIGLSVVGSLAWYGVFGGNSGSVALAPPAGKMSERYSTDRNLVDNEAGPSGFEGSSAVLPKRSMGAGSPESGLSDLAGSVGSNVDSKALSKNDSYDAGALGGRSTESFGGGRVDAVPTQKDTPNLTNRSDGDLLAATPDSSMSSDKSISLQQLESSEKIAPAHSEARNNLGNAPSNISSDIAANSTGGNSSAPPSRQMESRGAELPSPPGAIESSRLSMPNNSKSQPAPSMAAPKGIESFTDPAKIAKDSGATPDPQIGYGTGNPQGARSPNMGSGRGTSDRSGPGREVAGGAGAGGMGGLGGGGFGSPLGGSSGAAPASQVPPTDSLSDQSGQSRSKVSEAKKSVELKATLVTKASLFRTSVWSEEEMLTQLETNALLRQVRSLRSKSNNEPQLSNTQAKASPITIAVVSLDTDQRQVLIQLAQQFFA